MSRPLWQRLAVPVVAILVVVLVATIVLGVGLTRRPFPQTSGEIEVPGLGAEVTVLRDDRGTVDIYADTPEDLFRAQGFVAAQDRFFQMDLRRHAVSGRLAELVGEAGLDSDKAVRTMGWRRVADQELSLLSPATRTYLQAYASGVNAYLDSRGGPSSLGLEYLALAQAAPDYQVRRWDAVDSLAWLKAMAWDLRGNYDAELARGRLVGQLSLQQLGELYPEYPAEQHPPILGSEEWAPPAVPTGAADARGGTTGGDDTPPGAPGPPQPPAGDLADQWLADGGAALEAAGTALAAAPSLLGRGEGLGSNSWVVSGAHTESGMPLLANDPHLALSQPGVWTQVGLHCRTVDADCPFDVSGFSFAGFPGVIIGHNQQIAWGFTNLDPDVTDFYLEDVSNGTVRRGNEQVPLTSRTERIRVAGGEPVDITVRESSHGPLVSDVLEEVDAMGANAPLDGVRTSGDYAVALAWTGLEPGTTAEAVFALNAATGWEEFREAARLFAVPAQNMIYADVEGNIGYQAPGLVPIRNSATHGTPPGFFPAPGWDPRYAWSGWVEFDELPHALNPENGMIVTANQAVVRGQRPFLTSEFASGFRAARILTLLEERAEAGPLSVPDMEEIALDDRSDFARSVVPYLLDVELPGSFYTEAQEMLRDWDGTAPVDGEQSAAAAYFYAVYTNLLEAVFDDELPPSLAATGSSRWMLLLQQLLEEPESAWWDDQRTPGVVESRDEILRTALVQARLELTQQIAKDPGSWSWGELHRAHLRHEALGDESLPGLVRRIFDGESHRVPGGTALVNAMSWEATEGTFEVTSGPSMRMVVDLADLDRSTWVNQTGNSGHAFHANYSDQSSAWAQGRTYPWLFTEAAVQEAATWELTLNPVPSGR